MKKLNRREFLRSTSTVAGAAATAGLLSRRTALSAPKRGANETIRVGVIGVGSQGDAHVRDIPLLAGVQLVALCDIDESHLDPQKNKFVHKAEEILGRPMDRYVDIRKLLEDKSIDVVHVVTPNHWHSLASIWALQAGKDVYVEKPCSHTFWEGRQLVKAVRKYNKMVQHGTQNRSSETIREGIRLLHEGIIGDVYLAKGLCFKRRPSIGRAKEEPVPAGVHYDLWLGPAPQRAFTRNRFHYNWHWFWDYGNGDIGNQGVHEMDLARWGLGVNLPDRIQATGDKVLFDDDKEVPNYLLATFTYPEKHKTLVFEVRPWHTNDEGQFDPAGRSSMGVIFLGSEGVMHLSSKGYKTYLGEKKEPGPARESKDDFRRFEMFFDAVRSRKPEDLAVGIEDGHYTSAHSHLANIAYQVGRAVRFDPAAERFPDDPEADNLLKGYYRSPYIVPEEV